MRFILLSQINHHYLFSFSGCWCTEWRNGSQRNIISYSYPYDILYSNTFRFSPSRANPPRHNRGTPWLCLTCPKQEKNIVEQHFISKKQNQQACFFICLNILYQKTKKKYCWTTFISLVMIPLPTPISITIRHCFNWFSYRLQHNRA